MSAVADPQTLLTPEEFSAHPDRGFYELIDGELVELGVGAKSSLVAGEVFGRLRDHCKPYRTAWLFCADCGFQCFPRRPRLVRKPDVAVVLSDRLPAESIGDGWLKIPPDIAVEVMSPNDLVYEIDQKIEQLLSAGTRLLWVINPEIHTIRVHRRDDTVTLLRDDDRLSGEDVLPGFECRVADLFPTPPLPMEEYTTQSDELGENPAGPQ